MTRRLGIAAVLAWLVIGASAAHAQGLDPSLTLGVDGLVYGVAAQPDEKIVIGGNFSLVGGSTRMNLARINANGTLDTAFDPGTNGQVTSLALQPDGKILVAGYFTQIGGGTGTESRPRLARLNADGTVDLAFNPIPSNYVRCIALQPDGKILIAGGFASVAGETRAGIARLNPDGSADLSFNPGAVGIVSLLALQADGSVVVGGNFSQLGGSPRTGLGRVSATGVLDATFNPTVAGIVHTLAIQADGKIVVGGAFSGLAGASRGNIGRLETSGAIDTTFNPGAGSTVYAVAVYADGRIAVGGDFGSLAAQARTRFGVLNSNASLDPFDPGAAGSVFGLAIQPDGRVLVWGDFTALGNGATTSRLHLGRLFPSTRAIQTLTYSGGSSTITWLRGGSSPEVSAVEFGTSSDGTNFTSFGAGTRIAGGWELTGTAVPPGPNQRLRARAWVMAPNNTTGSTYVLDALAPVPGLNIIENGDFSSGTANWSEFATPTMANIQSAVIGGVYEYYRVAPPPGTAGQAVVFQQSGMPVHTSAALEAQFQIGNSDSVRKRISVLVHDADFSDLSVCTFFLAPNAALSNYTMRTHTTKPWVNATISFYAATANGAGNTTGKYRLDNVSLVYTPANATTDTTCVDPSAPTPPGGGASPSVIVNGDFGAGLSPWGTFGQIQQQITAGVFEFIKLSGTPAGVVLQGTSQPMISGQILTASFRLGNSSSMRKRVTVIVHDNNFSDLSACTFWLFPGQPLTTYTYRTFATQAWTNATVSVYPATTGAEQWIQLDDVTLQVTPGAALSGTHCIEPGGVVPDELPPGGGRRGATGSPRLDALMSGVSVAEESGDFDAEGFVSASGGDTDTWMVVATTAGRRTLTFADTIDLTQVTSAHLTFLSWLSSVASRATIEVSVDGSTWETVHRVAPSDTWAPISLNLEAWFGEKIRIRLLLDTAATVEPAAPDVWSVGDVTVESR